ncbi:DNA replication licensing factor MCM8 [Gracilaria domingensis]|nr:DNA replication licensing factor MCM8 [Gracilaria domingensis]
MNEDGDAHEEPSSPEHPRRTSASNPNDTNNSPSWNGPVGWAVYFPDQVEGHASGVERTNSVKNLRDFFLTDEGQSILSPTGYSFPLDYSKISDINASPFLRSIAANLERNPDETLSILGLAASRASEVLSKEETGAAYFRITRDARLWPRMHNYTPLTSIRALRGNSVGKFVAVRGTVVRVSNTRQQLVSMPFECAKCGQTQLRVFSDYKFSPPTSCITPRCRSKSFQPLRDAVETVDWQRIRIQELRENETDMQEEGRMPRTIDAELFSDLLDTCVPGDVVTICGVVRLLTIESGFNRNAKCLYYMYIEANSIITARSKDGASSISTLVDQPGLETMRNLIQEVVRERDPFAFLVHSSAPSIYGHELVKAGLVLALFGGSPKEQVGPTASESVAIRRDIHCLLVGDPGLGKSQMLKAMTRISPRGVYVCGNSTSTAGLTVTVVREATGDFALEAGALVLGDRGVCCIDEFDKMRAEHGALLEAMEQQSVSVAKAGLICNLSARTTVIAAANPVGGHYDRSRTVCENLKIALPLLSRFDLVFILMDKADKARDRFISEHVMKMFGMRSSERLNGRKWVANARAVVDVGAADPPRLEMDDHLTLAERLRECKVDDPLPPSLFREYVRYARTHVHPELSEGAKRELQEFYLHLRKTSKEQAADTTPITTRQLESLVRLSEARARSEMRTVVTREHARDVIEIMQESMIETLTDETGTLDLGRSSGMSRHKEGKRFIAALHVESRRRREAMFDKVELKAVAKSIGIEGERFERVLEAVNHQGFVMKKGVRLWEVQGSDFSDGCGTAFARGTPSQRRSQVDKLNARNRG